VQVFPYAIKERASGHGTEAAEQLLATSIDLMTKLTLHRDPLEREAEYQARDSDPDY
jgi:hypothetical protein